LPRVLLLSIRLHFPYRATGILGEEGTFWGSSLHGRTPIRRAVTGIEVAGKAVRQAVKVAGDEAIRLPIPPFIEDQPLLVS
jgi:hypothetical protein